MVYTSIMGETSTKHFGIPRVFHLSSVNRSIRHSTPQELTYVTIKMNHRYCSPMLVRRSQSRECCGMIATKHHNPRNMSLGFIFGSVARDDLRYLAYKQREGITTGNRPCGLYQVVLGQQYYPNTSLVHLHNQQLLPKSADCFLLSSCQSLMSESTLSIQSAISPYLCRYYIRQD
jgi:hypothetical protein